MKTLTNYPEIVISTDAVARLGFSWWRGLRSKHFVLDIMLGVCTSQGKGWNKQTGLTTKLFLNTYPHLPNTLFTLFYSWGY